MPLEFFVAIGAFFGLLSSAMACLIVYEEYQRHLLATRRLWKETLTAGAVAFIFFLVLSLAAGYWLYYLVR